jgi:hypothetical protein
MTVTDREAIDAAHRRQEFEQEAGEAVGPMPQTPPDNTQPPLEELRVDGTTQLAAFDAGGKRPAEATLKLTCGAIQLSDGQAFRKGDTLRFSGEAVVREVKQKDAVDKETGIVISCTQAHGAVITDLRLDQS